MEIDLEQLEIGFKIGAIFVIGFYIGILIGQVKSIKYDLNNDGKINLTDIVILRNYIMEEENGKTK